VIEKTAHVLTAGAQKDERAKQRVSLYENAGAWTGQGCEVLKPIE
jgi:hypothetical protein